MNQRIKELAEQSGFGLRRDGEIYTSRLEHLPITEDLTKFAELLIKECLLQVEQAKNSPFVSLDDAKRMAHFVDVTKKQIEKHFRN